VPRLIFHFQTVILLMAFYCRMNRVDEICRDQVLSTSDAPVAVVKNWSKEKKEMPSRRRSHGDIWPVRRTRRGDQ
jgi:hypothetical protein